SRGAVGVLAIRIRKDVVGRVVVRDRARARRACAACCDRHLPRLFRLGRSGAEIVVTGPVSGEKQRAAVSVYACVIPMLTIRQIQDEIPGKMWTFGRDDVMQSRGDVVLRELGRSQSANLRAACQRFHDHGLGAMPDAEIVGGAKQGTDRAQTWRDAL